MTEKVPKTFQVKNGSGRMLSSFALRPYRMDFNQSKKNSSIKKILESPSINELGLSSLGSLDGSEMSDSLLSD
mgnify:CR=1 FL=1